MLRNLQLDIEIYVKWNEYVLSSEAGNKIFLWKTHIIKIMLMPIKTCYYVVRFWIAYFDTKD